MGELIGLNLRLIKIYHSTILKLHRGFFGHQIHHKKSIIGN